MKYEMYVKAVLKQANKARTRAMIAMGLFFISGVILTFYSYRVAIAMLLPMVYLGYRVKLLSAEQYQATDAKCAMEFRDLQFTIQIEPYSKEYSGNYYIFYGDVSDINVYNQSTFEISVSRYALNGKTEDQSKVFRFSVSKDDYEKLVREINSRFERCEAEDNQT